ncbi:hypothetical protein [Phenylobacterium sp.]|uniref:hypothetical protein n=1 Tax=Phenylobacterium sp. TaxID=1871053 RepID=UPI002627AD35|nr:hypothetical protein [Phenylobacterium sp.]
MAQVRRCAVALDERKARRIMRERFPETLVVMSVDILRAKTVVSRLGVKGAEDAFEKAVQFGKMYVPKGR